MAEQTVSWDQLERKTGALQLTPTQELGLKLFKYVFWAVIVAFVALGA